MTARARAAALVACAAVLAGGAGGAPGWGGDARCAGHPMRPDLEVRICTGSVATRVPSWDGVPLDVDVWLPPETHRRARTR